MVWSHDPASGDWTLRPVTAVFISEYEGLIVEIDIHAADGTTDTITTTAEHPFLVASGEELRDRPAVSDWPSGATEAPVTGRWTEARYLRLGDTFVTRTGRSATVTGLTLRLERLRVYNLEVAGTHTYAVGQDGACVHNACHRNARAFRGKTWVYEVFHNAKRYKFGVTSTGFNQAGDLIRASYQVARLAARLGGKWTYRVVREVQGRGRALDLERRLIEQGTRGRPGALPGNIRFRCSDV